MSNFGEDPDRSLNEALARAKGEDPATVHAPNRPARGQEPGQPDATADGEPHGHEPVRPPEMGISASAARPRRLCIIERERNAVGRALLPSP